MVAAAVLKDFETAMRRTGRWADGSLLTIDELGQAVGLNMFTGRGRNAMVWEPEFLNRCDERYRIDITDPDTGTTDAALHKLEVELIRVDRYL